MLVMQTPAKCSKEKSTLIQSILLIKNINGKSKIYIPNKGKRSANCVPL